MADLATLSKGNGIAFSVSAALVLESVAAFCSSPQTAELNAKARSATLMKYVYMGLINAAFLAGIAAWIDKAHRGAIIAGAIVAGGLIYASYWHALRAGLSSSAPGTESY